MSKSSSSRAAFLVDESSCVTSHPRNNPSSALEDDPSEEIEVVDEIRRYLKKNYLAFLAHIKKMKSKEKRIQDIPLTAHVAKAPYRLEPSEMHEMQSPSRACG
ncbi:hypothetical protein Tco_0255189 [Tanacetum coccineum]